jgi:hypothetical protein
MLRQLSQSLVRSMHSSQLSQPLIRSNIFLSKFQRDELKSQAAALDISAAELARRILDKSLRRSAKK